MQNNELENKRVLITGASGMLGLTLVNMFSSKYNVYASGGTYDFGLKNYLVWDLRNENYDELIKWANPDVIIHCAALTNGNYCDQNPNDAFDVNGVSVNKLMRATEDRVKIIYISTDAVFPSKLHLAKEQDCVFPENVYGKSKELGEFFLKNSYRDYFIIRTTIVGLNLNKAKSGFVEWILSSVKNDEKISLFDDVYFTPISIWDLGKEIAYLIDNKMSSNIYHLSGTEIVTKYKFGLDLLRALNFNLDAINKGSILAFEDRAKRCQDQTLDCSLYQNETKRKLPNLSQTINSLSKNIIKT